MHETKLYLVEWPSVDGLLRAFEPTTAELAAAAPALADAYNDAHNRAMMAHSADMTAVEVISHFATMRAQHGRPFLLELDGVLMGDADLRHIAGGAAEFAIMVGQRHKQGKGLGTRFTLMLHALAFRGLELTHLYVTIIPANHASQRLFEKIGYARDDSPTARAYIDEEEDLTFSMSKAAFEARHAPALTQVSWEVRRA